MTLNIISQNKNISRYRLRDIPHNVKTKPSDFNSDGFLKLFSKRLSDIRPTDHTAEGDTANLRFEVQGQLVKFGRTERLPNDGKNSGGGVRSVVTEFSPQSRRRMIENLNRIDWQAQKSVKFITLTYGQEYPDHQQAKIHLASFIKRLRRLYPLCSGIWRVELQERGAPHFHLFIFNMPFLHHSTLARIWAEIIGDEFCDHNVYTDKDRIKKHIVTLPSGVHAPFVQIKKLINHRQAMYYVSKYMAKVAPHTSASASVLASAADGGEAVAPTSEAEAVQPLFINVTYLTAPQSVFEFLRISSVKFTPLFKLSRVDYSFFATSPYPRPRLMTDDECHVSPFFQPNPVLDLLNSSVEMLLDSTLFYEGWRGRHWGSFNKQLLPYAELMVIDITPDYTEFALEFANLCADLIESRSGDNSKFSKWRNQIVSKQQTMTIYCADGDKNYLTHAYFALLSAYLEWVNDVPF
ncbi:MAG: hypothetical protein AAF846_11130 [Chloroflexota bacterium]